MWPDGRRYEGNWYQGKPIGEGIKTYQDGTAKKGKWEGGVFVILADVSSGANLNIGIAAKPLDAGKIGSGLA